MRAWWAPRWQVVAEPVRPRIKVKTTRHRWLWSARVQRVFSLWQFGSFCDFRIEEIE